jgi:hypothetical protein
MLIVSAIILAGLVAAQVTVRLAQDHFEELRLLPRMPQEY